jgi:hypothetical protein
MRKVETSEDIDDDEEMIRIGIRVASSSPDLTAQQDSMEKAKEEGDFQEVLSEFEDWWDSLDTEERAQAISLDEIKGWEVAENALFIDSVDEDGKTDSVIVQW